MGRAMKFLPIGLALLAFSGVASAQVAPTPDDIAGYTGLHAAAHAGDATRIAALATSGEGGSSRVGNAIRPCEDWSVTPASWQANRRRYSFCRSTWSWRPSSLC